MKSLKVDASGAPVPEYEVGEPPTVSMEVLRSALNKAGLASGSANPEVRELAEAIGELGQVVFQLVNGLRWGEVRVVEAYE